MLKWLKDLFNDWNEFEKENARAGIINVLHPFQGMYTYVDKETFKKYKIKLQNSKKLRRNTLDNFTYTHMVKELQRLLEGHSIKAPERIELTLPKLELPKLQKIDG